MIDELAALAKHDTETKPTGADREWAELTAYYEDQSRAVTMTHLAKLGAGLGDNHYPIDLASILKRLIDGGATVYNRPPARFLSVAGSRLDESGDEHKGMVAAYEAARVDVALREVDRMRSLVGQMAVRIYPDDGRGAVSLRSFHPQHVMRMPNPATGDLMDNDRCFALRMSGGLYEYWFRSPSGTWSMAWVHEREGMLPDDQQPFAEYPGYASPYKELPVQMVYSDYTGGRPWIAPRQSRQGFVRSITAMANGIHELTHLQAHNTIVYMRKNPNNTLPDETGAGVALTIDADEDVKALTPSPQIDQSLSVVQALLRLFSISEHQPGDEFSPEQQIQTGAAQRVKLQPLYDRRQDQVPLAGIDEKMLWRRFRSVYNEHASTWGVAPLDGLSEMEIELRNLETPTTETEAGNAVARDIALGARSVIDWIMEQTGATRAEAISHYQRVADDLRRYPPHSSISTEGPQMTDAPGPTAPDEQPDAVLDGAPSVAAVVRSIG